MIKVSKEQQTFPLEFARKSVFGVRLSHSGELMAHITTPDAAIRLTKTELQRLKKLVNSLEGL